MNKLACCCSASVLFEYIGIICRYIERVQKYSNIKIALIGRKEVTIMTTTTNKIKTTTLCKNLLINAEYTTNDRFIGKSIGEAIFKNWLEALKDIKQTAFQYYEAIATERAEADLQVFEKSVYTAIKNLLSLVGDIPTRENAEVTSRINSAVLFIDAVNLAVKLDSKVEVKKLVNAREQLRIAKKEYRANCLNDNGIVKSGLNAEYIATFENAIKTAQSEVEKLLSVKGNSVFGTSEVKLSTFAKKFEVQLRKQMLKQYNFSVAEVKEQKQKQKQTRKANRSAKATSK